MFYHRKTNQYLVEGNPFTLDDIQYPANWLNLSTPEEKQALGITPVLYKNQPKDERFYWVSSTLDTGILTYTNTPKDLIQLKDQYTSQIKQQTYTILQPTDYIETRNLRDPNYKPEWITWRNSILDYARTTVEAIGAAQDVEALQSIVLSLAWPLDPSQQPNTAPSTNTVAMD